MHCKRSIAYQYLHGHAFAYVTSLHGGTQRRGWTSSGMWSSTAGERSLVPGWSGGGPSHASKGSACRAGQRCLSHICRWRLPQTLTLATILMHARLRLTLLLRTRSWRHSACPLPLLTMHRKRRVQKTADCRIVLTSCRRGTWAGNGLADAERDTQTPGVSRALPNGLIAHSCAAAKERGLREVHEQ